MKKIIPLLLLSFFLYPNFAISQNKVAFRLEPIIKKKIEGFETEGCRFTQNKTSKDRILLISFNGYVAVQIDKKIHIADYTYNKSTDRTTFVGDEISGYIKLTELGREDRYSTFNKGVLTVIYNGSRREISLYGSCDDY